MFSIVIYGIAQSLKQNEIDVFFMNRQVERLVLVNFKKINMHVACKNTM